MPSALRCEVKPSHARPVLPCTPPFSFEDPGFPGEEVAAAPGEGREDDREPGLDLPLLRTWKAECRGHLVEDDLPTTEGWGEQGI